MPHKQHEQRSGGLHIFQIIMYRIWGDLAGQKGARGWWAAFEGYDGGAGWFCVSLTGF